MTNLIKIAKIMLKEKQPVTSKTIASLLGVSTRSVISYISQINADKIIIHSVQNGYIARTRDMNWYLDNSVSSFDTESRMQLILLKLLSASEPIDIYDLAEKNFMSESSLINDVNTLNKQLEKSHVKILRSRNSLRVDGDTEHIKNLLASMINKDRGTRMFTLLDIYDNFEDETLIDAVRSVIREVKQSFGVSINEFLFVEFVMHCCITVHYSNTGYLKTKPDSEIHENAKEFFIHRIQEVCDVTISSSADSYLRNQFDLSFYGESSITFNSEDVQGITNALNCVKEQFNIDLHQLLTLKSFQSHLATMIERSRGQKELFCPITQSIQKNHAVLFEIGLFLARELERELSLPIPINEHEVALLAIHIGNTLNTNLAGKLSVALIIPERFALTQKFTDFFETNFSAELTLSAVHNYTYGFFIDSYDLVFSVYENISAADIDVYYLDLFDFKQNISIVSDAIEEYKHKQSIHFLAQRADYIFDRELFFNNIPQTFDDKYQIIDFLCSKLYAKGLIDDAITQSIKLRETKASTRFGKLAIPHEFASSASTSKIVIMKSQNGFVWDDSMINLVFLVIIGPHEKSNFHHYLSALTNILDEEHIEHMASSQIDFDQFLDFVLV